MESFVPFILIFAPFIIAFLLEAIVLYFFRLKKFWGSVGLSFLVNLVSIVLVYFVASLVLSKVGYEFNGLQLDVPVVTFLWWFSIIAEGLLLKPFTRGLETKRIFMASILMNTISYLFLYLFIVYSH